MKALYIAYYTALRNMRDLTNFTVMLAFPIVLTLILGSALSNSFIIENMKPVKVILVNEGEGSISKAFEDFLGSSDIKEMMEVEKADAFESGIGKVKQGEASALIYVKKGFEGRIEVYQSNSNPFKISVIRNTIDSFANISNTHYAAAKLGSKAYDPVLSGAIAEEMIHIDGKRPSSMDYYAISMLIMTMMYGTMYGCSAMAEEQLYKTEIRLKSAPVEPYTIYIGKVFGTILALMLDGAVIMLFTKYAYGVNWGNHIPYMLFACLSLAVLSSGLGIASFMLIGSQNKAQAILNVLVPLSTFLGGGYIPAQHMSQTLQRLSILSPSYLTRKIMTNIIFEGSRIEIKHYLAVIWTASLALFVISALRARRDLA